MLGNMRCSGEGTKRLRRDRNVRNFKITSFYQKYAFIDLRERRKRKH